MADESVRRFWHGIMGSMNYANDPNESPEDYERPGIFWEGVLREAGYA